MEKKSATVKKIIFLYILFWLFSICIGVIGPLASCSLSLEGRYSIKLTLLHYKLIFIFLFIISLLVIKVVPIFFVLRTKCSWNSLGRLERFAIIWQTYTLSFSPSICSLLLSIFGILIRNKETSGPLVYWTFASIVVFTTLTWFSLRKAFRLIKNYVLGKIEPGRRLYVFPQRLNFLRNLSVIFLTSTFLTYFVGGFLTAISLHLMGRKEKRNVIIAFLICSFFFFPFLSPSFTTGEASISEAKRDAGVKFVLLNVLIGIGYAIFLFIENRRYKVEIGQDIRVKAVSWCDNLVKNPLFKFLVPLIVFLCSVRLSCLIGGILTAIGLHLMGKKEKRDMVVIFLVSLVFLLVLLPLLFAEGAPKTRLSERLAFLNMPLALCYAIFLFIENRKYCLEQKRETEVKDGKN